MNSRSYFATSLVRKKWVCLHMFQSLSLLGAHLHVCLGVNHVELGHSTPSWQGILGGQSGAAPRSSMFCGVAGLGTKVLQGAASQQPAPKLRHTLDLASRGSIYMCTAAVL